MDHQVKHIGCLKIISSWKFSLRDKFTWNNDEVKDKNQREKNMDCRHIDHVFDTKEYSSFRFFSLVIYTQNEFCVRLLLLFVFNIIERLIFIIVDSTLTMKSIYLWRKKKEMFFFISNLR